MHIRLLLLSLLFALPSLCQAEAFTISDQNGGVELQFVVPKSPEVLGFSTGEYFETTGISDVFGTVLVGLSSPDYFAQLILGGSFGLLYFNAPQLYIGSEATPTLVDGTFDLTSLDGDSYTLNIAGGAAAAPEPSCLILCATGGALLLGAFFYRRSSPSLI